MIILKNLIKTLSLNLNVDPSQIRKKLALAPLYTLIIIFGLLYLFIIIQNSFDITGTLEILIIFLSYSAFILIVYFVLIYVFIYCSQLLLIKLNRLNFWFIMLNALVLTLTFSGIVILIGSVDLKFTGLISFFSIPIALMYWILLFNTHQKNRKNLKTNL